MSRTLHVALSGQPDNVGDVVLRRRLVQAVAPLGRLVVLVEAAPDDFVEGLRLPSGTVVHRELGSWLRTTTAAAARRRSAALVLNAGEITSNRSQGGRALLTVPAVLAGRARGVPTVRAGLGARDGNSTWGLAHRVTVAAATTNIWRDEESRRMFKRGSVAPDWAFDDPDSRPSASDRPLVAIGYRGDRPAPTERTLRSLQDWATAHRLQVVTVSQVVRDIGINTQIATMLGCEHIGDKDADLVERESRARSIYRSSSLVVSNRAHALIMGFTEGASPAGLLPHADVKIGRTLSAAGVPPCVLADADPDPQALFRLLDDALQRRPNLASVRDDAATLVREMQREVQAAIR